MKFPYLRLPGQPDPTLRPYVPAHFFYKDKRTPDILFLIDSGSDYTYADYTIAVWLGIDLTGIEPVESYAANNQTFESYPYGIGLALGSYELKIPVLFTENFGREGLLGEEVFFDKFRVIFERYKWSTQLVPHMNRKNDIY